MKKLERKYEFFELKLHSSYFSSVVRYSRRPRESKKETGLNDTSNSFWMIFTLSLFFQSLRENAEL